VFDSSSGIVNNILNFDQTKLLYTFVGQNKNFRSVALYGYKLK